LEVLHIQATEGLLGLFDKGKSGIQIALHGFRFSFDLNLDLVALLGLNRGNVRLRLDFLFFDSYNSSLFISALFLGFYLN